MYDGEQHTEFMDKLEERIRAHDKEIERMCNYHYQGFIESVNELLKVRGEARKLKVFVCHITVIFKCNRFCELFSLYLVLFILSVTFEVQRNVFPGPLSIGNQ